MIFTYLKCSICKQQFGEPKQEWYFVGKYRAEYCEREREAKKVLFNFVSERKNSKQALLGKSYCYIITE